jgi:hypothetical protein
MRARGSFRYLGDPVCVGAVWLYLTNRWILKPYGIGGDLAGHYFNDLLCLPLFLPMILYAQRLIGLRRHDGPPRAWEVLQHWLVFSIVFEKIVPRFSGHFRSTADPWDVVAYLVGGTLSLLVWATAAPTNLRASWGAVIIRVQRRRALSAPGATG